MTVQLRTEPGTTAGQPMTCQNKICVSTDPTPPPPPPPDCGTDGDTCSGNGDCCTGLSCEHGICAAPNLCADTLTAAGCGFGTVWTCGPGTNLAEADLSGCNLAGAFFNSAVLFESNGTELSSTNFSGANLSGSTFQGISDGSQVDFSGADLSDVIFDNLFGGGSNFTGANLTNATFRNSSYLGFANFADSDVTGAAWIGNTGGGTTCPDSTNSASNNGTCCGHFTFMMGTSPVDGTPSAGCGT